MSYKMLEHSIMQQRKHAWTDWKKKPSNVPATRKCGLTSGKISYYSGNRFPKPSTYGQEETNRLSYSTVTYNNLRMKRALTSSSRTYPKNAKPQSQVLPPVFGSSGVGTLTTQTRQSGSLERAMRGELGINPSRTETISEYPEKEHQMSTDQKAVSTPGMVIRLAQAQSVSSCCTQKTFEFEGLKDISQTPVNKTHSPYLYRSCMLVISSRKVENYIQAVQTLRNTMDGKTQHQLVQKSKVPCRDILTKRSTREVQERTKAEEKLSSGDSAFGTDTYSESDEVEIEFEWDGCNVDMDHYTQQRIITWIIQVNLALFSPHITKSQKSLLTEQDTSIKIVYEGD